MKTLLLIFSCLLFGNSFSQQDTIHIKHQYYTITYDTVMKVPVYTSYLLTKAQLVHHTPRSPKFTQDSLISLNLQFKNSDYNNSGYDRGHLFADANNRFSAVAERDCMKMTNIAPQNKTFNEQLWKHVEDCERDSATKYNSIEGVTGCVYGSNTRIKGIPVPTYYFKVVKLNGVFLAAWLGKNETPQSFDATTILVSQSKIESATKMKF